VSFVLLQKILPLLLSSLLILMWPQQAQTQVINKPKPTSRPNH